jgi:hypothetical protein
VANLAFWKVNKSQLVTPFSLRWVARRRVFFVQDFCENNEASVFFSEFGLELRHFPN